MAELLSTVVLLQLAAPGCAVISAPEPAVADLRTGLYQCGAPEAFLMTLACLEMSAPYGLPTQGGGLGGDGRYPDFQEGAEGVAAALLVALCGADSMVGFGTLRRRPELQPRPGGAARRRHGAGPPAGRRGAGRRALRARRRHPRRRPRRALPRAPQHPGARSLGRLFAPAVFRRGQARGEPGRLVAEAAERAAAILETHEPEPLPEDVASYIGDTIATYAARRRAR